MAGLGLGGLAGGRLADRMKHRTMFFGVFQAVIAAWALAVPLLLARLRVLAPDLSALLSDSLLVSTLIRFTLSFAILLMPCFLMGATFPLLAREVTRSDQLIGRRVGALYCWNTPGAAFGCLAAVGVNLAAALARVHCRDRLPARQDPNRQVRPHPNRQARRRAPEPLELKQTTAFMLLIVALPERGWRASRARSCGSATRHS